MPCAASDPTLVRPPTASPLAARISAATKEAQRGGFLELGGHEDDTRLLAAMRSGDRLALATLYDRYAPMLLAIATRILGERREAEDLVHDVMLEVWRHCADYASDRGTVRSWLLVRLRSRAIDRKKSVRVARVTAVDPERLNEQPDHADPSMGADRGRVLGALAALPDEQRIVLELGYFEGLSSSEIAARIEVPLGTVKSRVAAALAKLRAGLGETGVER